MVIIPDSFDKYSNTKFYENTSIGSRAVPYGHTEGRTDGQTDRRTDRHDEANSAFHNIANNQQAKITVRGQEVPRT